MLDSFEARVADLIADELGELEAVQLVTRPQQTVTTTPGRVAIVVRVMTARPDVVLGDDVRERIGARGQYQLRTTLRLSGQLALDVVVSPDGGDDLPARRSIVTGVMDRLLVVLQRGSIRSGQDFQTGVDLGFDLDGFRFAGLAAPAEAPERFSTMRVLCDFAGRFWPVEPLVEGDAITGVPTRIAVLPVQVPDRLQATAGRDLTVPLRIDLRALNGAAARVMARLKGASPPGELVGSTTEVPAGWVAFVPDADGSVAIVYRPPATVATPVRVGVTTALSRERRPFVSLAELDIEVIA